LVDYSFQEGLPAGFDSAFEAGIFFSQRQLELQADVGWHSFVALDHKNQKIVGAVHYHVDGLHAQSPFRSPYGSFIFSHDMSSDILKEFVTFAEHQLKRKGIKTLLLKNAPKAYAPAEIELLENTLLELRYDVELEEVSSIIPIGNASFESLLHRSHKKKIRKCRENGLVFEFLPLNHVEEVYGLLKSMRQEKNYSLSMSLDNIQRVISAFPDNFFLTVVKDGAKKVAANISVKVNSRTLYNFYHDHLSSYDSVSPVVLLNGGLYAFCQQQGFALLDLGTSTIDGKLDSPLFDFKCRLGGRPSSKRTFIKKLL
jgi:hypothetical protein